MALVVQSETPEIRKITQGLSPSGHLAIARSSAVAVSGWAEEQSRHQAHQTRSLKIRLQAARAKQTAG